VWSCWYYTGEESQCIAAEFELEELEEFSPYDSPAALVGTPRSLIIKLGGDEEPHMYYQLSLVVSRRIMLGVDAAIRR
jgi:hypothetical protein